MSATTALDMVVVDAEFLRRDQRQRGARAADVDRSDGKRDGAVHADIEIGAGLAAEIEPEAAGHAASLVLAERRLHVRMVLRPPPASGRCRSDRRSGRRRISCPSCAAFLMRNSTASMPILPGEFVDHAFDGECRHRRRGRAIGRGLRPVDQHFVADRPHILEVIAGKRGHRPELGPDAGIGAAGVAQGRLRRGDRAVLAWRRS